MIKIFEYEDVIEKLMSIYDFFTEEIKVILIWAHNRYVTVILEMLLKISQKLPKTVNTLHVLSTGS